MSTDQHLLADVLTLSTRDRAVLDYLHHRLPGYPFDPDVDRPFVAELHNDFPHLDVLEQIKLFRWYHDNRPPLDRRPRATLRRWIGGARVRGHRPQTSP